MCHQYHQKPSGQISIGELASGQIDRDGDDATVGLELGIFTDCSAPFFGSSARFLVHSGSVRKPRA